MMRTTALLFSLLAYGSAVGALRPGHYIVPRVTLGTVQWKDKNNHIHKATPRAPFLAQRRLVRLPPLHEGVVSSSLLPVSVARGGIDKSLSMLDQWLRRTKGVLAVSMLISFGSMFAFHFSSSTALGLCFALWNVELSRVLITRQASKCGFEAKGIALWLLLDVIVSYCCWTQPPWGSKFIQAHGSLTMLALSIPALSPRLGARMYGIAATTSTTLNNVQGVGFLAVAFGTMVVSLGSQSIPPLVALASTIGIPLLLYVPRALIELVGRFRREVI
ncbi:expressed unknown protein [Seminavis robusta]|uniref:Uncharacterized protein n=1 Tax=Seminavis robusta TaxID=568900 RepID=A0A9N8HXP2_9STRA|nr:expressed unknown protein [Seminavis robusta]|eukprot:Sro2269_g321350.1 n/a (275) ;mRNA; f:4620-5444